LRGKRIRGAEHNFGAAIAQGDGKISGFAGDVQTSGKAQALERLLLDEALADQLQNGHLLIGPFHLALALFGEAQVLHIAGGIGGLGGFFGLAHCDSPFALWMSCVSKFQCENFFAMRGLSASAIRALRCCPN
jgi:hypothetical protein